MFGWWKLEQTGRWFVSQVRVCDTQGHSPSVHVRILQQTRTHTHILLELVWSEGLVDFKSCVFNTWVPAFPFVLHRVADIKGISLQHMTARYVAPCSFNQSAQSKHTCSRSTDRSLNSLTHSYVLASTHSHMEMRPVPHTPVTPSLSHTNEKKQAAHAFFFSFFFSDPPSEAAAPVLNKCNFSQGSYRHRLILLQNTPQHWCLYTTRAQMHMWTGERINVPDAVLDTGLCCSAEAAVLMKRYANHVDVNKRCLIIYFYELGVAFTNTNACGLLYWKSYCSYSSSTVHVHIT